MKRLGPSPSLAVNLSKRGEYVWNLSDFEWQKCDTWIKFQEGQNMINLTKLPRESFDSWTVGAGQFRNLNILNAKITK